MHDEQYDFWIYGENQTEQEQVNEETGHRKEFDEIKRSGERMLFSLKKEFQEDLNLNSKTIEWLDKYVSEFRDAFSKENLNEIAFAIGYILGQTIIEEYGGAWEYCAAFHRWSVNVGKPVGMANPIGKVEKYLVDSLDSIFGFFEIISLVVKKGDWNIGVNRTDIYTKSTHSRT